MTVSPLIIHQSLFGYRDGHRLLASSMKLGDQSAFLTQLSDLAPGAVFGESDGYWTGLPVPKLGRYVLLRTWPAPEMPRPGCVWTHALLIDPDNLGDIADLGKLRDLACRPRGLSEETAYREPLQANIHRAAPNGNDKPLSSVRELIATLYEGRGGIVHEPRPGVLDTTVFAVWSQQWPKLRRNFRFQTAASREPQSQSDTRFDIMVALGVRGEGELPTAQEPWLSAAVADVLGQSQLGLRNFLWRYGDDVRRQRGSFRPLTEIKLLDARSDEARIDELFSILQRAFPDRDDAAKLKQDIADGLVVPGLQLEILRLVLSENGEAIVPPPSEAGIDRLAKLWPTHSTQLLHIAEQTADETDRIDGIAAKIFDAVTSAIPIAEFWRLTADYPKIRRRMVSHRADLLLAPEAAQLDSGSLITFLEMFPDRQDIARALLPRLLERDDTGLAETAMRLFPEDTASLTIIAADGGSVDVGRAWIRALVSRPDVLLRRSVLGHVSRTSLLYEIAAALGWLTSVTIQAGTDPWIAAHEGISSTLSDERRDTLRAFMVAIALAAPGDGARRILEQFFGYVHGLAAKSDLPWKAQDILRPVIPDAGWGWGNDFAWRLRQAVVRAYISNNYSPESFAKLSQQKKVREQLADAAKSFAGGKPYARAINGK